MHELKHCQHDRISSRVQIHVCDITLSSKPAIAVMFQVISVLPFSAKNAFVSVSFGIIFSSVQKFCVLFSNYFVFAKL